MKLVYAVQKWGAEIFAAVLLVGTVGSVTAQDKKPSPQPAPATDDSGPVTDSGSVILQKKKEEAAPPPAPAQEKTANPGGASFSIRVDVPIVSLDVGVLLDKNHQFVPGLKLENFKVTEDGVEQQVATVRTSKTPITAVLLLEFASNSYAFIYDMRNAAAAFFRQLQPNDYIAVETFDLKTHIVCDFTNDPSTVRAALETLTIPTFSETDEYDALYETLDRLSRVEGRKYIFLIGTGRDTFSKINLDKILAKIKATPNVTIFTMTTGAYAREITDARGGLGNISRMNYLQADNEMKTFAQMTGGLHFQPLFQGELPDDFGVINESIRNQYVITYKPTNTANDGSYRKVRVSLVDAEGKPLRMQDPKGKPLKYSVITRDGYKAKQQVE